MQQQNRTTTIQHLKTFLSPYLVQVKSGNQEMIAAPGQTIEFSLNFIIIIIIKHLTLHIYISPYTVIECAWLHLPF